MRRRLFIAAIIASPALGACAADPAPSLAGSIVVDARPLAITDRSGKARLIEGFDLVAADPRFGGFSGMALTDRHFYLMSDRGWLWWAERAAHGDNTPSREWRVAELKVRGRRPDAEELAILADGRLAIAMEGAEALAIIPGPELIHEVELRSLPADFKRQPTINEGIEALATLADGSLLAISEGQTLAEDCYLAMRLAAILGQPSCYRAAKGFRPTGAARAGQHLLVLERHFALFRFETRVTATPLQGELGARLEGTVIASIDRAGLSENYEAIAVDPRSPASEPIDLWIVADDNFNALQRTRLLHLSWQP